MLAGENRAEEMDKSPNSCSSFQGYRHFSSSICCSLGIERVGSTLGIFLLLNGRDVVSEAKTEAACIVYFWVNVIELSAALSFLI